MGSLLALRPDFDISSLRTEPARIIATALINYGSYVVDSSGWDTHYFATEFGPDGRVIDDFASDWGFPWITSQTASCGNAADASCAWSMDMGDIFSSLHAITNNSPSNVGGPGARLAPCAPPFADGTGGAPADCSPGTSPATVPPVITTPTSPSGTLAFGGAIHGYNDNWNTGSYLQTADELFNAVTATAYMPWGGWTNQASGPQTYGLDRVVDWARPASGERALRVHGHTLVYPLANATLDWYRNLPSGQHEAVLERYVTEIAESNAGDIWVWDVVNEVMAEDGESQDQWGVRNDSIEYQSVGADFVDKAFEWAAAADPNALLIINDYGAEEVNGKSDRLLAYATELRDRGVPIDGVGFQMHLWASRGSADFISMRQNFERFTNAGFKVYITELDVPIVETLNEAEAPTAGQLEQQRAVYEEVARIARDIDGVESLFMWDFVDNRSWLHPVRNDSMEPFVDEGTYTFPTPFSGGLGEPVEAKSSYQGLVEGLNEAPLNPWFGITRLQSGWESSTGYLTRSGMPDGRGGFAAGDSLELHPLTTETSAWSSMHWVAESAPWGFVRIRSDWEGGSGYLTRRGDADGQGGYTPGRAIDLSPADSSYASQLWRLEPAGNGQVRIVNAWDPGTGVISRDSLPDNNQAAADGVSLLTHNPAWTSQLWDLAPLSEAAPALCFGRTVTVNLNDANPASPTNGDDVILGTPGNDTINALGGDDIICSGSGDDTINGGFGIDRIFSQAGNDTIFGEGGSDVIMSGPGNDIVWAGSGADHVWGGPGDDLLNGMGGQDTMYGGQGRDTMQGNWQSDRLFGGPGDDIIRGAAGKDRLYGEGGDDELYGGVNTDFLDGGPGNDIANGQRGRDHPLVPGVSGCVAEQLISC